MNDLSLGRRRFAHAAAMAAAVAAIGFGADVRGPEQP